MGDAGTFRLFHVMRIPRFVREMVSLWSDLLGCLCCAHDLQQIGEKGGYIVVQASKSAVHGPKIWRDRPSLLPRRDFGCGSQPMAIVRSPPFDPYPPLGGDMSGSNASKRSLSIDGR